MKIEELSIVTLQFTGLVLPYVLFMVHNSFRRWWWTSLRAVTAVGAGWLFWLAFVFAADALNRSAAKTEQEINALNNGDGAKFVFALVFGWVVPGLTVALAWAFHRWLVPRIRSMGSNKPLVPTRNGEAPLLAAQRRR
jgi:hypothetical protein